MATEITIKVESNTPDTPVQPFVDAILSTLHVLRDLDSTISMRRRATLRWTLGKLSYGSPATITMVGFPPAEGRDVGPDVARRYIDGLRLLSVGKELPDFFSESALQAAKRLAQLTRDNARSITITSSERSIQVTQRIGVNIDDLMNRSYASEGTVEGVVEMATLHERTYFRIYDAIHGWGIPCYFATEMLDDVRDALGRRVIASGSLRSDHLGKPSSMRVNAIRRLRDDDELPSPKEIRGIAKGMTEGRKAEDYLREIRGDDR